MHHTKLLSVLFAIACSVAGTTSYADDCLEIHFKPGERSTVVNGMAPADGVTCLRLPTQSGQAVRLSVTSHYDRVGFTVDGLADNRSEYAFTSTKQSYDLLMHQTMRAVSPEPYSLTVSID